MGRAAALLVALAVFGPGCGARPGAGTPTGGGVTAPAPARSSSTAAAASVPAAVPAIRGPAGAIALETVDGRPTTLAAHGKPVTVIALWATFCAPCLDELPFVDALARRHQGDDVAVLAINVDDRGEPGMRERVAAIERDLGLRLPRLYAGDRLLEQLSDRGADGAPRIGLPLLVVIDPAFRIHRRMGFDADQPLAEYLDDKEALIAAARRGEPPAPAAALGAAPPRLFKLRVPKMDAAQRATFVARFRAEMAQIFPHLSPAWLDALVARADAAARTGGEIEVDLGTLAAPVPPPPP